VFAPWFRRVPWREGKRKRKREKEREREGGREGTNGPPGNLSLFRGTRCNFDLARERQTSRAAMKRYPRPRPRGAIAPLFFFFIYLFFLPNKNKKKKNTRRAPRGPRNYGRIETPTLRPFDFRLAAESSSRDMTGVITRRGHDRGMEEGGTDVVPRGASARSVDKVEP